MLRPHQDLLSRSTAVLALIGPFLAERHPPRSSAVERSAARGDAGERKLVAALLARDPAVGRELWDRYAPMVFRVLGRTLGPEVPLEDAVHEVFLHVLRGRSLRADSDLRLFVLKSTARVAYLCLRMGRTRWPRWGRRWRPRRLAGADRSPPRDDGRLALFYATLDELSPLDRIAFVLRFVEGLEIREVAVVVSKTVAWLETRLAWILAKMTRTLEPDPAIARRS